MDIYGTEQKLIEKDILLQHTKNTKKIYLTLARNGIVNSMTKSEEKEQNQ